MVVDEIISKKFLKNVEKNVVNTFNEFAISFDDINEALAILGDLIDGGHNDKQCEVIFVCIAIHFDRKPKLYYKDGEPVHYSILDTVIHHSQLLEALFSELSILE